MTSEKKTALQWLELTSKTFYIPITRAPSPAREALISSYLCVRAVDQVEDHPTLDPVLKMKLLKNIGFAFMEIGPETQINDLKVDWLGMEDELPEVSLRVVEWLFECPASFRIKMAEMVANEAIHMALWIDRQWKINSEADLNGYTFAVTVNVGLNWADIFAHFNNTPSDSGLVTIYTRSMQGINILLDRQKDLKRGVDFWPPGWTKKQMTEYVMKNLAGGQAYLRSLPEGSAVKTFFQIPFDLAVATLKVREQGQQKLTRQQVLQICKIRA